MISYGIGRRWQRRHIFWTKEKIYFTRRRPNTDIDAMTPLSSSATSRSSQNLDSIVDSIPLDEIEGVNGSEEISTTISHDEPGIGKIFEYFFSRASTSIGNRSNEGRPSSSSNQHELSVIQIYTQASGFNSGRTYYLRIPGGQHEKDISDLCALARTAKQTKEATTRFKQNQEFVRKIYTSTPFQYMIAALITAVRHIGQLETGIGMFDSQVYTVSQCHRYTCMVSIKSSFQNRTS